MFFLSAITRESRRTQRLTLLEFGDLGPRHAANAGPTGNATEEEKKDLDEVGVGVTAVDVARLRGVRSGSGALLVIGL